MQISIIIINYNTQKLLINCIDSIYNTLKNIDFEIIMCDNASVDNSCKLVSKQFPAVKIIKNTSNLGFGKACNKSAKLAKGKYLLILNTDTILQPYAIQNLYNFMEQNKSAGMCGPQLLNADKSLQNSIDNFASFSTILLNKSLLRFLFPKRFPGKRVVYKSPVVVESLVGACMFIRKDVFNKLKGFDEDYFFFFEETDLCLRLKKNKYNVYFIPDSYVIHLQGKSSEKDIYRIRWEYYKSRYIFLRKNFYNDFQIKILKVLLCVRLLVNVFSCGIIGVISDKEKYLLKSKVYWHIFTKHINYNKEIKNIKEIEDEFKE